MLAVAVWATGWWGFLMWSICWCIFHRWSSRCITEALLRLTLRLLWGLLHSIMQSYSPFLVPLSTWSILYSLLWVWMDPGLVVHFGCCWCFSVWLVFCRLAFSLVFGGLLMILCAKCCNSTSTLSTTDWLQGAEFSGSTCQSLMQSWSKSQLWNHRAFYILRAQFWSQTSQETPSSDMLPETLMTSSKPLKATLAQMTGSTQSSRRISWLKSTDNSWPRAKILRIQDTRMTTKTCTIRCSLRGQITAS